MAHAGAGRGRRAVPDAALGRYIVPLGRLVVALRDARFLTVAARLCVDGRLSKMLRHEAGLSNHGRVIRAR